MSSFTPETIHSEAAPRARGLTFRTQLMLGICGLVLLTGAAITWLAHLSARQSTNILTDSLFREASAHVASETRAFTSACCAFRMSITVRWPTWASLVVPR